LLEPLLKTLSEELQLGSVPAKQENNTYELLLRSDLSVKIQELEIGVSFWGRIALCPSERREELFILLMKANFLGQGTGNSSIALDENENFLTLSSVLPYDMNYKMFKDALEDFVNYLDYWKEELERYKKTAEEK
jgi:Tir chaperone protein (CesT) family